VGLHLTDTSKAADSDHFIVQLAAFSLSPNVGISERLTRSRQDREGVDEYCHRLRAHQEHAVDRAAARLLTADLVACSAGA
jgi:hypothetical protein